MPALLLKPTALVLAISVITVVTGSDNETAQDGDFRRQLPEVLDRLCPYSKTCRGGDPRLKLDKDSESCCTGVYLRLMVVGFSAGRNTFLRYCLLPLTLKECSCEDSCGLTETCCYPEQAVQNYFDRSIQQCQVPSSISIGRAMLEKHFYMVNSGYGNGSRENCGTENVTCGENETASALGSLYPVSSKTTGVIYKNEQCARCHGVAKGDMMLWEAKMTCMIDRNRMDTLLQSLETGRIHPACWLDFYYPGPQSEVNVHRCYEHTMPRCLHYEGRSYNLPSYLNMTDEEVRSACLTGPQAQYGKHYNVFCFLCSYRPYSPEDQCLKENLGDRSAVPGSFTAVLRPSLLAKSSIAKTTDIKAKSQPLIVCRRLDGLRSDADDCRPALCPSGKVRQGADRRCVHPDKTLNSRIFKVTVELHPGENRSISPLIDHLSSYLQKGKDWRAFFSAPGLNSWRLSILCYPEDTQQAMNNGAAGFFWLKLTREKKDASSLAKILANVGKFMTGDWEIVVNTTSVPLEQRFSDFEDIEYDSSTNTNKQRYADNLDPELSCSMFDRPTRSLSIQITKTFFCDQVALNAEEYVLYKSSKRLYVNATGRVFSPAEYMLGYDASGDPEPRLCLGDTDFVLVPQQNPDSASGAPAQLNWSMMAVAMIAQLLYSG